GIRAVLGRIDRDGCGTGPRGGAAGPRPAAGDRRVGRRAVPLDERRGVVSYRAGALRGLPARPRPEVSLPDQRTQLPRVVRAAVGEVHGGAVRRARLGAGPAACALQGLTVDPLKRGPAGTDQAAPGAKSIRPG